MISGKRNGDRGFALVAVLVVLAFLSILALTLQHRFRSEARVLALIEAKLEARAVTDAALTEAIIRLTDPDPSKAWVPDGRPRTLKIDGQDVSVTIRDELGKIDINTAEPALLRRFLVAIVDDNKEVERLVDVMADWRDADNTRRAFGAEVADYRREGRGYVPSNRDFETVEELARVKGMEPDLFGCIAPALTVHSHRRSVDEGRAHELVVKALGLDQSEDQRRAVSAIRGGLGGRAFEVELAMPLAGNETYTISTILRITENRNEPYWFLDRREGASDSGAGCLKPKDSVAQTRQQ